MINIKKLTEKDFGEWVIYKVPHKTEIGRIKSWNEKYIFVVYKCNNDWKHFELYTGCATNPKDLSILMDERLKG
jgi:hypothetical protein